MDHIGAKLEAQLQRLEAMGRRTHEDSLSSEKTNVLPFMPRQTVPNIAQNRGWTEEQEQEYARRFASLERLQAAAGIPPRYQSFSWETWPGPRRGELLTWPTVEAADGRLPWAFVAFGPPGSGKTHIAAAVFLDLLCRGWTGRWYEVSDAIEELKAEFDDEVYEGRTMKALKESQVLVLDELGAERQTEFNAERIAHVLRYRYSREKFTIISTNLDLAQLDAIDPRLSSRLGGREAIQWNFTGSEDWRL